VSAEMCGRELSDGVGPGGRLLQHKEVAGPAQCPPKGAAVNCLMVSAQTAGCSSMRKWPAPLSVRRKVRPPGSRLANESAIVMGATEQ
jgi:hypothetical protein